MFDSRKIQLIKNVQNLGEFGGTLRQAILAAGYSKKIADNPKRLTDRKWLKAVLPDYEKTANAVHDLMDASKLDHYIFPASMSDQEIAELIEELPGCKLRKIRRSENQVWAYFWTPDNKSKKEAIDIVLKVNGDYAPEKLQVVDELEHMTTEEIEQELDELKRVKAARNPNMHLCQGCGQPAPNRR